MKEVMWDMIRADQYVSDFLKDSAIKKKDESVKLYDEIFKIHKISREQFKESLDYYSSRPDLFRPIIDSLAKRGNVSAPYFIHPHPGTRINRDSMKSSLQKRNAK